MQSEQTELSAFLKRALRPHVAAEADLIKVLEDVAGACREISYALASGRLAGERSACELKALAAEIVAEHCAPDDHLAGVLLSDADEVLQSLDDHPRRWGGRTLLTIDPLDGASNIDISLAAGTIFSVIRAPAEGCATADEAFLQAGEHLLAAGYALYGSATLLVLTLGEGVFGFTLDRESGTFALTHPEIRIDARTDTFLINASNERFWEPPVRRYVNDCLDGFTGPRGQCFNMRWAASMVANVHRVLMRGGLLLYPQDVRDAPGEGRTSLLTKAAPMAMLVEAAGGRATTGYADILAIVPASTQQKTPVILGAIDEATRLIDDYAAFLNGEDRPVDSPLFTKRSLFRRA